MFSSVDLPLPEGPSSTTNSPAEQIEVDAAQRVHVDLAHVVDLGDLAGNEDGGTISQIAKSAKIAKIAEIGVPVFSISQFWQFRRFWQFRYLGYAALVLTSSICAVCRALCAERKRTH